MHIKNLKSRLIISLVVTADMMISACSLINEDMEPCPEQLRLRFKYEYFKETDAFNYEVGSINVWAFDDEGRPVWSGQAKGPDLKSDDFFIPTSLKQGNYNFVAWCGLDGNPDFDLVSYSPFTKTELEVTMKTEEKDGVIISDTRLHPIYHGSLGDVDYKTDPNKNSIKTVTVPLIKDTKEIRVMLQHYDGREIKEGDFSVSIKDNNSEYAWDNSLLPSPSVTYKPWKVSYAAVTSPDVTNPSTRDVTTVSALVFDFSTGRLMTDSKAVLTVHRKTDDRDIIRIPLIDYLLLVKGYYGNISDQKYLDIQDIYSITFFIDSANSWYVTAGIFINGWAVVPPQDTEM